MTFFLSIIGRTEMFALFFARMEDVADVRSDSVSWTTHAAVLHCYLTYLKPGLQDSRSSGDFFPRIILKLLQNNLVIQKLLLSLIHV